MDFYAVLDQVLALLQSRRRVTYRALKRQFNLDDDFIEDLKDEIIKAQRLAVDEAGEVLVWAGTAATTAPLPLVTPAVAESERTPLSYTPQHLAAKILQSKAALEGERKQVTVLFCDLANSTGLAEGLGPEEKLHTLARVTALGGDDRVIEQTVTKLLAYAADRHHQDLEDIAAKLRDLEAHFGMASAQFDEQFQRGELGDDEAFLRWDALLEMQRRVMQRLALLQADASP